MSHAHNVKRVKSLRTAWQNSDKTKCPVESRHLTPILSLEVRKESAWHGCTVCRIPYNAVAVRMRGITKIHCDWKVLRQATATSFSLPPYGQSQHPCGFVTTPAVIYWSHWATVSYFLKQTVDKSVGILHAKGNDFWSLGKRIHLLHWQKHNCFIDSV